MDYRIRWREKRRRRVLRARLLLVPIGVLVALVALLLAYPRTSGVVWEYTRAYSAKAYLDYEGGFLAVAWEDGGAMLLNAQTGQAMWPREVRCARGFYAPPLIHDGIVYLVGDDYRVRAIAENTGQTLWEVETEGTLRARPAIAGELLIVGSDDGKLYGLNRRDGAEVWRCELLSPISGAPAVVGNTVVCGTVEGRVSGVDVATGAFKWRQSTKGAVMAAITVADGKVVACSDGGYAYVIAPDSGQLLAAVPGAGTLRTPAVSDGTCAALASTEGYLFALTVQEGKAIWTVDEDCLLTAGPILMNGQMVYALQNGGIVARDLATGQPLWRRSSGVNAGRMLATDGRLIFVATENGSIMAQEQ